MHPSSPSNILLSLIPRLLIPRSCLPLACLEPCGRLQGTPGSQFFSAYIVALEESNQPVDKPTVLITETSTGSPLYAIERVKIGVYAICKLGAWVTLQSLELASIKNPSSCSHSQNGPPGQEVPSGCNWWQTAAIQQHVKQILPLAEKQKTLSGGRLRLCLKAPSSNAACQSSNCAEPLTENMRHVISPSNETDQDLSNLQPTLTPQSPAEVLNTIKIQYHEALYVSKVR